MWLRAFLMVCLLIDGTYVSPDRFNAFTCLSNNLAEQLVRSQSQSMAGWAEWFRVHATADFRCVHTIVVLVVPQPQAVEDRISFGNQSITVAAFRCQVEFDQRIEAIPAETSRRIGLRREVAEQLCSIGYHSVAVAIQSEPRIIRFRRRPR